MPAYFPPRATRRLPLQMLRSQEVRRERDAVENHGREGSFSVAGSVDHEIRHLLPLCEGCPLGNCGAWWPPGTTCGDP